MTKDQVISQLKKHSNPDNVAGMARFGISSTNTLGVNVPTLRNLAKQIKKDHPLAIELWQTGIHEARILASMIADPKQTDKKLMDDWVKDFDSWDVCDQVCSNLYEKVLPLAYSKAVEWSKSDQEFIKRAGYVLMARFAVGKKQISDQQLIDLFPILKSGATDERNFVKKAVNWALRQIGKRNRVLHPLVLKLCFEIQQTDSKAAKWIAKDAIRELEDKKTIARIKA